MTDLLVATTGEQPNDYTRIVDEADALLAADRTVERQLARLDDAMLAACSDPDPQRAWSELRAEMLERLGLGPTA